MANFIHSLQEFVWGRGMLVFFLGAGIWFTIRSGFFQITKIHIWTANTIGALKKGKKTKNAKETASVTQFQSFCTALAATLGTGNITGVATALMFGGPGAIFWMWVSAFFGMMTTYAENFLGIKYRYKDEKGQWKGGAMVYMERGLGCKPLAVAFAVCCLGASFGMGNMVQGNSMAVGLEKAFHVPAFLSGSLCMIVVAVVLTGGMKRIAIFTERFRPALAAIYFSRPLLVLFFYRDRIAGAFALIFQEAFRSSAAVGGVAGYSMKQAVRMGIARGIFSNEAGLGSSVMAHAQSDVEDSKVQGMWGILEVFIDTVPGPCTRHSSCNIGESSAILAGWRDRWNNAYGNGVCICYSLGKGVFGRGNRIVCFCHNDWLVLFWCTDSRLSGRRKGCKGISFLLYFDYTAGMYDCSDYDLGIVRCLKRNDGSS